MRRKATGRLWIPSMLLGHGYLILLLRKLNLYNFSYQAYVTLALTSLPHLQLSGTPSRPSSLIVISSLVSKLAVPNVHFYAASKHAITGFFSCLRWELKRAKTNNVQQTVVILGSIGTESNLQATGGKTMVESPEETAKVIMDAGVCKMGVVSKNSSGGVHFLPVRSFLIRRIFTSYTIHFIVGSFLYST